MKHSVLNFIAYSKLAAFRIHFLRDLSNIVLPYLASYTISNGNRTEWSPIRSVII